MNQQFHNNSNPRAVLVSGASGLVGRALCEALVERGHKVSTLSRGSGDFTWDVRAGELDLRALDGVDVIVHLAGETVAQRWTTQAKSRIMHSRVDSTRLLVNAALAQRYPPALVMASGANYYGFDRSDVVDEADASGRGFLAEVCRQWEGAAEPMRKAGGRVVWLRTGMVLSKKGGALAKMLPAFRLGLGGRIGSGEQRISWIGLMDLVRMFLLAIEDEQLEGAVNAVAPKSVSNQAFTDALGRVLRRPTVIPVPKSVVRLAFGEMGQETLLANVAVRPTRLIDRGFEWLNPDIETALSDALKQH